MNYLTLDYFGYRIKSGCVLMYNKVKYYWDKIFNTTTTTTATANNTTATANNTTATANLNNTVTMTTYDELWEL